MGEPWTHTLEIKEISLSQAGTINDRQLIVVDRNRDLYLLPLMKRNVAKLAAMCDSARWHDNTPMLAAMVDQRLVRDCPALPCPTLPCLHTVVRMRHWCFCRLPKRSSSTAARLPLSIWRHETNSRVGRD